MLNLYSYQEPTRKAIYSSLDQVVNRIWSPHQVMLEFHRRRPEITYQSRKAFDTINKHFDSFVKKNSFDNSELLLIDNKYGKIYPELREMVNTLSKSAESMINEVIKKLEQDIKPLNKKVEELKTQTVSLTGMDKIHTKLKKIYTDEKVGKPFTQEVLNELYNEGETRYAEDIPPGYKDANKPEEYLHRGILYKSKFGDLILYKQILSHCLEHDFKNVVFISEDNKEDWRENVPHENNKYYGIRREIREEAFKEANILNFLMFNTEEFIKHSKVKLDINLVADLNAVHENYISIISDSILDNLMQKESFHDSFYTENDKDIDNTVITRRIREEDPRNFEREIILDENGNKRVITRRIREEDPRNFERKVILDENGNKRVITKRIREEDPRNFERKVILDENGNKRLITRRIREEDPRNFEREVILDENENQNIINENFIEKDHFSIIKKTVIDSKGNKKVIHVRESKDNQD